MGQVRQDPLTPLGGAFWTWRIVSGRGRTGKAESHWENRDLSRIVEDLIRHAHPLPQTVTTRILEGHAGQVDSTTRSLPSDQNRRVTMRLKNRTRAMRKVGSAVLARPDVGKQFLQFLRAVRSLNPRLTRFLTLL